jgi:methionine sulfoxide reductase heme-binding subunit
MPPRIGIAMHGTAPPTVAAWQLWCDRRGRLSWLRIAALALLLFPLAKALIEYDTIVHGARPLNDLIHRAGFWTLVLLGMTLAVTPFRQVVRYGALVDIRRMIGVGTFCYAAAHLSLFIADQQFNLAKVVHEITHRVYLVIGFTAWLGLAVLAITSIDRLHRALGPFRWRRLHQIIYGIALLALIHYFQQTKADVSVPVLAASLFGWLILYRVLAWWQHKNELSPSSLLALACVVAAGLAIVAVDIARGWQNARLRQRKVKRKAAA